MRRPREVDGYPFRSLSGTAWCRNAENSLLDSMLGMDCREHQNVFSGLGSTTGSFCCLPSACLGPSQGLGFPSFLKVCLSVPLHLRQDLSKGCKGSVLVTVWPGSAFHLLCGFPCWCPTQQFSCYCRSHGRAAAFNPASGGRSKWLHVFCLGHGLASIPL